MQSGRAGATLGGMKYAILRTQKLKATGAVWRSLKHAFREQPTPNADPDKAAKNEHVGAASAAEAMQKVRDRLPEKRRKDAVLAIEYLITASPEAMQGMGGKSAAYFNDALKWLRERHGRANVVYAGVHRDESTPHMYAYVVPLDESTGRLNARRWLGGSKALSEMQTDFAATVGAQHGLERGIKGSRAKHERVKRHYGLVNQAHDQAAELGMLDKASLVVGKPTKKAQEALESADATLTLAHEFQARQRAVKVRERALHDEGHELRNQKARAERQQAQAALAQKQVQELRQQLEAEKRRAAKADELAELYRSGRDQAIDELRALRPQRGHGLERYPPSLRGKAAHGAFHLDAFGVGLQGGICDIGAGQDQGQRQNELESLMHSDECCVTTAPKQCFFRAQSNAVPVSPILQTLLGGARKTPTICWSKRYR